MSLNPRFLELAALASICFVVPPADAIAMEDAELDALLSLDISDLTVSVASKKEEQLADAPGVINVVTAEDIRRYGCAQSA